MKFKEGDEVKIIDKSIGRPLNIIDFDECDGYREYPNRIFPIFSIRGNGEGINDENCIVIFGDYYAPEDLVAYNHGIDEIFEDLIAAIV